MEQLAPVVKAQISLCQQLLELNKMQTQALVRNDHAEVQRITQKLETATANLSLLERRSQSIVREISAKYNINEPVSLIGLLDLLDEKNRGSLEKWIRDLGQIVSEIQICSKRNKLLQNKALNFIDFNISVLTSTMASATYAPPGQTGALFSQKKMFDQSI